MCRFNARIVYTLVNQTLFGVGQMGKACELYASALRIQSHLETTEPTNQIKTDPAIIASLGDMFLEAYCDLRSGVGVYRRYRINRLELWVLKALGHFQRWNEAGVVSKIEFVDSMTKNSNWKHKIEGALVGLSNHGFIGAFEYVNKPGSLSICISDLGYILLQQHKADREALEAKYSVAKGRALPWRAEVFRPAVYTDQDSGKRYADRRLQN